MVNVITQYMLLANNRQQGLQYLRRIRFFTAEVSLVMLVLYLEEKHCKFVYILSTYSTST